MTDQKDDLVAEARVALAIKQAADVCDAIRRAADEIVNAGADFQDYHSGKAWASEECHDTILALPHDPEALEAYVQERVDAATGKIVEAFRINMMRLLPGYSHEEFDADIRAMKGEGHD